MNVSLAQQINADISSLSTQTTVTAPLTTDFQRHLADAASTEENAQMKYLTDLREQLIQQGYVLAEKSDVSELRRYRTLVAEFLNETLKHTYSFNKESLLNARGRHKVFSTVKIIDEKLGQLTQQVIEQQQDNIQIVDIIDDIRGLIIDLLV